MMHLTAKDALILSQSQLQRAIELCALVGFPEGVTKPEEKVKHITEKVVPYLMKQTVINADNYLYSTIDKVSNKG